MRQLDDDFFVSAQVQPDQLADLAAQGIRTLINNRPDGEMPGQPAGESVRAAAEQAGIAYVAIPVTGLGREAIADTQATLSSAERPILAFCAAGTRSTYLWALARAQLGDDPETLFEQAAAAGYDLSPVRAFLAQS